MPQEENKTLKAILNSLTEGVVVIDKEGKFLFMNPTAEKILGMGPKDVKADELATEYGAYHLDKITTLSPDKRPLARVMKGEEVNHEVIFIRNKERPEGLFIDVTARPLRDNKGEINGGTIIFRDITERIEAQAGQKEFENRLNDFFDELPIPSYIWQRVNDDFILIKHNKAGEAFTKGNIKKFLGLKLSKMYEASPYLEEIKSKVSQCINEKKSVSHEMQYQFRNSNEIKSLLVTYVFIQPDLIMVNTEDITERKLAEMELRKLSNAVEQTADSVVITDSEGVIEYVNPAFEMTTGFRRKEVVGKTPRILKSGKHGKMFYKNLWDTIRKGNSFYGRIINKKKNNQLYWSAQTITPMKDEDGKIINYVSVLRDITEIVEKEKQELQLKISQEQNKKLEELDQMKSHFFANISHEFRTPLTLILGPSENIINESNEEETKKKAGTIKNNANRLLDLINQLLDLSKLEAGKLELKASKGNIVSFIKGVTMSFESKAEEKDIILKAKAANDEIDIYFDMESMTKIMTNLLSNAFKISPQGGMITVKIAEIENKSVEIKVKDTGLGLSKEELPKIFDRFYQVDSSNTREHEGTGIGLALTKELVELHHGTISVDSKLEIPGKVGTGWTEFTIKLPLGRAHLSDDEIVEDKVTGDEFISNFLPDSKVGKKNLPEINGIRIAEFDSEMGEEKPLILVVEDNAEVREYIKDSLGNDYQIEEASNGEQGVRKAENIIPDLIISDIMMPKMDGNELILILKSDEKTSHIPIILLTAKSEQESKLEGLETGADDYLIKPFNTKELQVRIKNLINIRRKLQKKYSRGDYSPVRRGKEKKRSDLDEKFICKVMEVIENHISEEDFNIEQFGKEVGMSRVQLHRKLKALTGKSPSNYVRSVRLSKAKKFIEEEKGNISEIAYSVGFSSPAYFTRCFKEEFGYPPSEIST